MVSLWCGFGYRHYLVQGHEGTLNTNDKCRAVFLKCIEEIKKTPNKTQDDQVLECAKKARPL
jgi:phosphoketolase